MDAPWFGWVVGCLATWRLTQLLVRDDGPWDLAFRLRRAGGDGAFGRALDCFACCSLWCAAPVAWWIGRDAVESVLAWLAMSGAACLLDRVGQPPLMMQTWTEPGGADELLRPESKPMAGSAGSTETAEPAGPAGAGPGGTRTGGTEPGGAGPTPGEPPGARRADNGPR
jgi:hypothetical protein